MERRQNSGHKRYIVQQFMLTIADDNERVICHLYMRNYSDCEVRSQLNLSCKQLELIKQKIAMSMRVAGICDCNKVRD